MAKIFKPRRALRSSVKSGSKRTLVLASGELMLVGKTAIGEGSKADLYLGDGVSQIQNLSPAMYGDTSEEDMTITDDTSTTASAALGNVTTGKTLGAILGSLKKAISLNAAAITTLNDDLKMKQYIIETDNTINETFNFEINTYISQYQEYSITYLGFTGWLNKEHTTGSARLGYIHPYLITISKYHKFIAHGRVDYNVPLYVELTVSILYRKVL